MLIESLLLATQARRMLLSQEADIGPLANLRAVPNILIIDDDEVDFHATRRMLLKAFGDELKLSWISDWEDAKDAINGNSFDVYLIDYFLGGRTGLELVNSSMTCNRLNVFIFLTGHDDRDVDVAATEAGASDYLVKSDISPTKLERSIRYALFMAGQKEALRTEAATLKNAKAMIERQAVMHELTAKDLSETKKNLKTALKHSEEIEEKYRQLGQNDVLTGLANRTLFCSQLDNMIAHSHRHGRDLAVLMLDLDHFKSVNDSLGRSTGDNLLKRVALRLKQHTRKTDIVARLGGDEFAIVATNLRTSLDAAVVAQNIVEAMTYSFTIDGQEINVSVSIGIATPEKDCADVDNLLAHADAALHKAKDADRGTYRFFDTELDIPDPDVGFAQE